MNNGDVASVDRLSALPEALILKILHQLPVGDAVATSVLSKQWHFLWQKLPHLKFDSSYHNSTNVTFSDHVTTSLLSQKSLDLESLDLRARLDRCTQVEVRKMIDIACSRNVHNLNLEVQPAERFIFPKNLFNCNTLKTLKLKYLVLKNIPSSVCLRSLRTLCFDYVDFQDVRSVSNFLYGCVNLENLAVRGYPFNDEEMIFTIAVPSLQRLVIYDVKRTVDYVIYAPVLKYLKIEKVESFEFSVQIDNLPELEEAHLIDLSPDATQNILGYLTSAKHVYSLELPFSKVMFPTGSIFYRLTTLELEVNYIGGLNLLTVMLRSSPELRFLTIIGVRDVHSLFGFIRFDEVIITYIVCVFLSFILCVRKKTFHKKWNQPKNIPECLLFCLETFSWKEYEWNGDDNTEIAKFILSTMQRAMFSTNTNDSTKRAAMVEGLKCVVMASKSCQLQVT